jgi:membrane-associated phospholipid phosphatase/tRNA A-37 threonylcarbamoyl transferase component Bud32
MTALAATGAAPTERRRPSGEAPPLPRAEGWARLVTLLALILAFGCVIAAVLRHGGEEPFGGQQLRAIRDAAPQWLTDVSARIDVVGSVWFVLALRLATLLVAASYARWRQLVAFLGTIAVTDWIVVVVLATQRPIPAGVTPLSDRATYWFPSQATASLAVTLAGMAVVLVPVGRARSVALAIAAGLALLYAFARVVLAADYPLDAGYGVLLGVAAPLAAFAAFVPDDVFPVRYKRTKTSAHLDLGGRRGEAIVVAMREQLGVTVTQVKAFGLEGSGGSSPLRMTEAETNRHLFAKIYNRNHLRADRWYRFGRTLLYGQLEDEVAFASVRRLVEYEDYALRLLDDVGVRVARPYGIVELTPHAEYMLVTEFFEEAQTMTDAQIDDAVIDDGVELVRTLWDHGLAHRDIKPANLLVRDGRLQLVDVSGLEVRPTAWRQSVDLANMMLTLALRSDPDPVYERATKRFTPDELAEAFAADVGMAVPTQLRSRLKDDTRPIVARFKQLAPEHAPISIQRWSLRRTGLLAATAVSAVIVVSMLVDAVLAGLR